MIPDFVCCRPAACPRDPVSSRGVLFTPRDLLLTGRSLATLGMTQVRTGSRGQAAGRHILEALCNIPLKKRDQRGIYQIARSAQNNEA